MQIHVPEKRQRNRLIRQMFNDNVSVQELATRFETSEQRVHQIIRSHRNLHGPETL